MRHPSASGLVSLGLIGLSLRRARQVCAASCGCGGAQSLGGERVLWQVGELKKELQGGWSSGRDRCGASLPALLLAVKPALVVQSKKGGMLH